MKSLSPTWARTGVYVEYGPNGISLLAFANGTTLDYRWERTLPELSIRWECMKVEENDITLNVTLALFEEVRTLRLMTTVRVGAENRNVTLLNGSYLGKTLFWLSPNPRDGETIILTENTVAEVLVPPGSMETIQGSQRAFIVNDVDIYDLDTGILLASSFSKEVMLRALNISKPMPGDWDLRLSKTNVDLGPREWWPEITSMLPILMPVTAFVIVASVLFYRRRRKHKLLEHRLKTPTRRKG